MSPEETDRVLEAVADGVLDALREYRQKATHDIRLSDCLDIANKARRRVAAKLNHEVTRA